MILDHFKSFDEIREVPHISSFLSEDQDMFEDGASGRPYVLVVSANDENSLRSYCTALDKHLSRLDVKIRMPDLAYTLSERRTHLFHRAYAVVCDPEADEISFHIGKKNNEPPKIGYVFTGQGAQWPQMGKALIENFPAAKPLLEELNHTLQQLPDPPPWSLIGVYSILYQVRCWDVTITVPSSLFQNSFSFLHSPSSVFDCRLLSPFEEKS